MTLGERVRFYRLQQGLTQLDLAVTVGKDISTISKIETNSANPSLQTLLGLSQALGVATEELLKGKGDIGYEQARANGKAHIRA